MTGGGMSGARTGMPHGDGGKLAENVMHFGRVLRAAGLPIGPGSVIEAVRAVDAAGLNRREDLYWTLHAVFVNRRDQRELFDQAFHIFWRNPKILEKMMSILLPSFGAQGEEMPKTTEANRRLADAFFPGSRNAAPPAAGEDEIVFDAAFTYSDQEALRKTDFETMSADELAQAHRAIARMRLPIMNVHTRRFRPDARGTRIDMRATMRATLRSGGDVIPLRWRTPRLRHPPLVILCDISGSMSRYSRMFLLFMHAITSDRDRVHTFVFGTRLTNISRYLRHRDVDVALARVTDAVDDWSGGTRIGKCLHDFNTNWSRRVLGQGALVLFISDGLDRDEAHGLEFEIERLHKSCRRLIWLNPLMRFDRYEAKAAGAQSLIRHVDEARTIHNLESMSDLAAALVQEWPKQAGPRARTTLGAVA
jgi:uncharacterized protein with von Willebrand factor type A (vWA) domain